MPGSHKARFTMPCGGAEAVEELPNLRHISCRETLCRLVHLFWSRLLIVARGACAGAGDLLFFCGSAQTHGVLAWQGEAQRRCVIHKYAPLAMALPTNHHFAPDFARKAACL